MADVFLDGVLDGAGSASGSPQVVMPLAGALAGAGAISGAFSFSLILSGQLSGAGFFGLSFQPFQGTLAGTSNATLSTPIGIVNVRGRADGLGSFAESVPLPVIGVGNLTGFLEIEATPPSICCCCCTGPTTFAWGQSLGENLTLCITTPSGQPYAPARVSYALYFVKGEARFLIGSATRTPSPDGVGCYHATGFLGDCGQPGSWLIVWTYCDGGVPVSVEQPFEVTAGLGISDPCGCGSHGWG